MFMQVWGVQECAHAEARGGPRVVSSTTLELILLRQSPLWDLKTTLWIAGLWTPRNPPSSLSPTFLRQLSASASSSVMRRSQKSCQ